MDGFCEIIKEGEKKGTVIKGDFKQGLRHGYCKCTFINESLGINYLWEGEFENDVIIKGILKGDDYGWKNMNIEFKDGTGKGTYTYGENECSSVI